ncbi:MAG: 30S ribosomal protein S4e [Methanomicrobiales archaeon]|nr:30S ribosomal protein S4e [Methanomicrobiales archaeon]MDD1660136.1 30S ribosomal protein S4e [Methanomicrobiales archaeon]
MSHYQKRYTAPDSWHIEKKTNLYIVKTAPGPHNREAMPVAVWLRDHMDLALTMREVRQILNAGDVVVNGKPCRDPRQGIGVFDIISVPKMNKQYRILLNKRGRFVSIEISPEDAKTRLSKIRNKTILPGGIVQLNLLYGANILGEQKHHPRDSVVLSLESGGEGRKRFEIVDHFPFQVGHMAMVIGGRHSGRVGRIVEIQANPGNIPNRVVLEDAEKARFDTIDNYIFMIGRETPAMKAWGIEE